ncbi:hypothetical protein [Roseibacillus persicicus]|uniref:hypothetical protein n=1 Tax=Roseibacillus persicicus TaxID=454148 RepID=UPI0016764F93|nr:hypothetical protein [Roseibacillus persicicus]MDQ8189184.1 hypothetical protein [Roseibacillus persicicus]
MESTLYLLPGVGLGVLTIWSLVTRSVLLPIPALFDHGLRVEENESPKLFWFFTTLYGSLGVTFLILFVMGSF